MTTEHNQSKTCIPMFRQTLKHVKNTAMSESVSLPGNFYTDVEFLNIEKDQLFRKQWICAGRVEEIPDIGDYFTLDLLDEPLIVVRGTDGNIRVLSNVCRHRATVLMNGTGCTQRFVCPYHQWVYDTDGRLLNAPSIESRGSFDIENCRLPKFISKVWQGFIFVTLNANPPDLFQQLSSLDDIIGDYHLEQMHLRYLNVEHWEVNWKSLIENFMEGYHLSPLHKETLHKVNPTKLCRHLNSDDAWFGYDVGFTDRVPADRIGHPDLSEEQFNTCVMFAVPPGLTVGVGSDYSSFLCIQPETPTRVKIKLGLIFYGDTWSQPDVDHAVKLFQDTMAEDKVVLLDVQRGVKSRFYSPGPLAPAAMEGTVWDFHQYLARNINL